MVAGHYCFQPSAGRTSTALRQFPLMHSGHVLDAQGNCIALPSGVNIPTDDVTDLPSDQEFLHIRFQGHIGYVRRKYVSWIRTYHGGTYVSRYSHLSTESWWLSTWSIQTDSLHVRCRHSNQEVDHESMGLSEVLCTLLQSAVQQQDASGSAWRAPHHTRVCCINDLRRLRKTGTWSAIHLQTMATHTTSCTSF